MDAAARLAWSARMARAAMFVAATLVVAIALLPAPGSAAPAASVARDGPARAGDLSGTWRGSYTYQDGRRAVAFECELQDRGGRIAGRMREPNTFGDANAMELTARVVGVRERDVVVFAKSYDGAAGAAHTVGYYGRLGWDARTIEGVWTLDGVSGRFTMRR